jgi:serine/threonine-protein kinase
LAKLDNQHLVRLYNFGELDDGQLFLAMEYGGSATLADAIRANGSLEVDRALLIAQQVCEALEEAHQHAIVHRDLKPQNILLGRKGTQDWVKVVDVGIAKILDTAEVSETGRAALTRSGSIIGTPAYFSPEQARGLSVDARSDLYTVGVVLYEMLVGQLPLVGLTPLDYVRAHTVDRPTPFKSHGLDLPSWVEQLVMKALEKDPAKRFQTAQEMQDALGAARERIFRTPKRVGRRRAVLAASGIALVAVAAAAVLLVRGTADEDPVPVEIVSPVARPQRPLGTAKLEGAPTGATGLSDVTTLDLASPQVPAVALQKKPTPTQTRNVSPETHMLAPPPPSVAAAPSPGADPAAARLLEEAAQLQEQRDPQAALLRLERALALGPSRQFQVRALRSLAELNYRGGNSRRALGDYERLRPLVTGSERAAVDARIQLLREELGH